MVHETPSGDNGTSSGTDEVERIDGGTIDDGAVAFALSALVHEDHAAPSQPTPVSEPPATPVSERAVIDQLARTAAELSNLVEHHRRELVDAMGELTRLQRELRSETRAAIAALRDVGSVGEADVHDLTGQPEEIETAPVPDERVGSGDGRSPWANGSG